MCVEKGFCTFFHCRAQILARSQVKDEARGLLRACVCTTNHQAPWCSPALPAAQLLRARTKITLWENFQSHYLPTLTNTTHTNFQKFPVLFTE